MDRADLSIEAQLRRLRWIEYAASAVTVAIEAADTRRHVFVYGERARAWRELRRAKQILETALACPTEKPEFPPLDPINRSA